jgi:hypothetical protein
MSEFDELQSLREGQLELEELLLDCLEQACLVGYGDGRFIDNCCLSAYENACVYLSARGLLKRRNPRIYDLVERKRGKDVEV